MRTYPLLLLIACSFLTTTGQELKDAHRKVVLDFIEVIKTQNTEGLAIKTFYPLKRKYPIPAISDKQDFIKRYNLLFDNKLVRMILNSDPARDWHAVGWRGIALLNGIIWLDYDGRLMSINYQTAGESKWRRDLVQADKDRLNPSIQSFVSPIVILETAKFRIRIDDLGSGNYRYVSWPLKSSMKDRPSLILTKGELIPEGSGGNHKFVFATGNFTYECAIVNIGTSATAPQALLRVSKDDKEILRNYAKIL